MATGELAPWRPFRELERWARRFPSFFEDWPFDREEYHPALESFLKNGNLVVRADVPGVDPKDVEVSVRGNVLTIKGERKEEKEVKSEDYIRREASYGSFERRMTLPEGANTDKITANFKNGMVEITMPMAKAVEAKKVPVQVEAAKSEK
ncbi:MAG: Hsp20/alpha crystallin family protein [Candidatus Binataceae bacterium]